MGLLPATSDAMCASAQRHGSTASDAADVHRSPLVHCRQCAAWIALSTIRTLSTHRTSVGIVTYFRCPGGHADFCQTSTAPPWSPQGSTAKTLIVNAVSGAEEGETNIDMDTVANQRHALTRQPEMAPTHGELRTLVRRTAAWMAAAVVMSLLSLTAPLVAEAAENQGNANVAHLCQKDGHLAVVGAGGETFATTGQCVAFVARGGAFATGLVIPAGAVATLSQVSFGGACDPLAYGYQVSSGPMVSVDSKPGGCPYTAPVAGATVGPFPTAVVLRIFLEDRYCGGGPDWTYYSDGNHALVTPITPGVYLVGITDSFLCTVPSSMARSPSGPGTGDLRLTLTIS